MSVRSQRRLAPLEHSVPGCSRAECIDLDWFHLQLLEPDFVWDMVKYTLTFG
jgi:hypothetical protein